MTRKRLGQALAAALILALCGCKDLKIHTENDQKKFRFGQPVKMWLTYKKKNKLPDGAAVVWLSSRDGRIGEGQQIETSSLAAGKHEITVTGTYKGKKVKGKKFKLEIKNDAPQPKISSPASHESVGVGDTVKFAGTATDREDGEVPAEKLSWSSSQAGELGSGASLEKSDLRPGTHTITLKATDKAGASATATVKLTVHNKEPRAVIESPTSAQILRVGEALTLKGHGIDPDPLHGLPRVSDDDIEWHSSRDGKLGTGEVVSVSTLSGGDHTIELRVKDEFGKVGRSTIKVEVKNRRPTIDVLSPGNGSYASVADSIRFEAKVNDPDGFPIEDQNVVWRSNKDGEFGKGVEVLTDELSEGEHKITVTVTDKHGGTREARLKVLLTNEEPVARIRSPHSGKHVNFGEDVTFEGGARDKEDGKVSDLRWTVLRDGEVSRKKLGKGRRIKIDDLPFGTHRVFLVAKDSDGKESKEVSIEVTVDNRKPQVSISGPGEGAHFTEGTEITLSGSALDPDRNTWLGDAHLKWTATRIGSVKRTLGNGKQLKVTDLLPGRYVITLVATDPDDSSLRASAKVRIKVNKAPVTTPTNTPPAPPNGNNGGVISGIPGQ